jgi:hypothetical protein
MVVGVVGTIVFAVLQSNCDAQHGGVDGVITPHAAACRGYGTGAGIGLALLAAGAVLLAVAALCSTPVFDRRRPAPAVPADAGVPPEPVLPAAPAAPADRPGPAEPEVPIDR